MVAIETGELSTAGLRFSTLECGPPDGPVVLCLHGFPDSPDTFHHQFGPLAEAGRRVIAPRLRGYEPSSQPHDGDYGLAALADDVFGWLDDRGVERADLVGHDWGAVIAYVAAARSPERVATITALAIPPLTRIPDAVRRVPRQLQRSWYMTFFQLPGVPERALVTRDWWLLRRLWQDWSPDHDLTDERWTSLRAQFEQPGVVTSALAYYRQNATPPILLGLRTTPEMEPRAVQAPALIVNGSDDGCMDRRLFELTIQATDFPGGVHHLEVGGAGHFVHEEKPDVVNAALLDHLDA